MYFFWGAGAYPKGDLALIVCAQVAGTLPSTFSPYDSGGLHDDHLVAGQGALDAQAKEEHLRRHSGGGGDLEAFGAEYLAAHFEDAQDYVTHRAASEPDFEPYHGLRAPDGQEPDRRAWTLEVACTKTCR